MYFQSWRLSELFWQTSSLIENSIKTESSQPVSFNTRYCYITVSDQILWIYAGSYSHYPQDEAKPHCTAFPKYCTAFTLLPPVSGSHHQLSGQFTHSCLLIMKAEMILEFLLYRFSVFCKLRFYDVAYSLFYIVYILLQYSRYWYNWFKVD